MRSAAAPNQQTSTRFAQHIHAEHLPHAVIIDCSSSADVAARYPDWLASGIHIVTPNKKANSADLEFYARLHEARRAGNAHYLYEATVGAGLPVIQTLRDLRDTGDEIRRIEGMLSGTLPYLFNVWDGSEPFSSVVRAAKAQGLHRAGSARRPVGHRLRPQADHPRARDGTAAGAGRRAARKPGAALRSPSCTAEEFLERLPAFDTAMAERLQAARSRDRVLRYVGSLDAATGKASVGLVELERSHTFANINLTDNVVRFLTQRYNQNPLVVQGPGAGPEVTAGGVFGDLLRVCAYLGVKL